WRYGGDFGEVLHDGNFVIDGLADAESRAHPGLLHWAESVAPVRGTWSDDGEESGRLAIESRRQFTTCEDLALHWRYEVDGRAADSGSLPLGPLSPAAVHTLTTPQSLAAAVRQPQDEAAECLLLLEVRLAQDTPWARAGHVISRRQHPVHPPRRPAAPAPAAQPVPIVRGDEGFELVGPGADGAAAGAPGLRFTPDGHLVGSGGLELSEHGIDLWRAPTDNDEGHGALDYEAADPALTRGAGGGARGPSSADRWRGRGLDRLVTTTREVSLQDGDLIVRRRLAAAGSALAVNTRLVWTAQRLLEGPEAGIVLDCRLEVEPVGAWAGAGGVVAGPAGGHLGRPAPPAADRPAPSAGAPADHGAPQRPARAHRAPTGRRDARRPHPGGEAGLHPLPLGAARAAGAAPRRAAGLHELAPAPGPRPARHRHPLLRARRAARAPAASGAGQRGAAVPDRAATRRGLITDAGAAASQAEALSRIRADHSRWASSRSATTSGCS